jgi:anti-sigma regulatory factor (Ser/Thr protein kinase)
MQTEGDSSANGRVAVSSEVPGMLSEIDGLRLTIRRQASVIDSLGGMLSNFRAGTSALRAENAELRGANGRMREVVDCAPTPTSADTFETTELRVAVDAHAPAASRTLIARWLTNRAPQSVLERAQLVASELTTNSVRHSGAQAGDILKVRLELSPTEVRIEVSDPGRGGTIEPRVPDVDNGGGFGLNLVQMLSHAWGTENLDTGETRVWARFSRRPVERTA